MSGHDALVRRFVDLLWTGDDRDCLDARDALIAALDGSIEPRDEDYAAIGRVLERAQSSDKSS